MGTSRAEDVSSRAAIQEASWSMTMLSPEQESYREELANRFGGACVLPLPGHSAVAICGWDGDKRADGAVWEWLHESGAHGPVDGAHPLRELLAEARPYVDRASRGVILWDGAVRARGVLARIDDLLAEEGT